jgi:uncharacterized membrane protein
MNRIFRVFLAGFFALLPLFATVAVTVWLVRFVIEYVGPNSTFGNLLTSIGLSLDEKALLPYLIGMVVIFVSTYIFGLLVETRIGPWFNAAVDALLLRVPVVGSLYQLSKRFVSVVNQQNDSGMQNMKPVWCFFGGDGGAAVLALLPSAAQIKLGTTEYVGILVPSAPMPVGGALIYVPDEWIQPADVGIDQLVSVYVSMGMTPPDRASDAASTSPVKT